MKTIENNPNMKDYIEKYILPYDTDENQLSYERGQLEYDTDYVKEHMEYNELYKNDQIKNN